MSNSKQTNLSKQANIGKNGDPMNLRKQKRTYESEQRLANESEQTNLINNYEQTNLNNSYEAQGRKPQPQTSKHLESEWVTES